MFLTNVVGAQACIAARAGRCDLSQGIVADDPSRTLIIHLRTPDPSFLSDLVALPGRPIPLPAHMSMAGKHRPTA